MNQENKKPENTKVQTGTVNLTVDEETRKALNTATNKNVNRQLESLKNWREQSTRCSLVF